MTLSTKAKHEIAVNLLSNYLIKMEYEHMVFSSDRSFDIYIPSSKTRIKVFCNYSNSKSLKISNTFKTEDGVLYLVIKPTRKNKWGFSSVGGDKTVLDNSIKVFNTKGSPKNIQIELLRNLSTRKYIENAREIVEQDELRYSALKYASFNVIQRNVNQCRTDLNFSLFIPEIRSSNQCSYL